MATKKPPAPPLDILGSSGLNTDPGGAPAAEFHRALRGPQGKRRLREMAENEPVIGGFLAAVSAFVRQADRAIHNPSETAEGERLRVFVSECVDDMSASFSDLVSEVVRSIAVHGHLLTETVYKVRQGDHADPRRRSAYSDNLIGWRKWAPRPPETIAGWDLDSDGGIRGAYQMTTTGGRVFLPIERCLLFRTETLNGNPEGRSLLRNSWTSYHYATNLREIEAIGIERDITGLLKLTAPPDVMSATPGTQGAAIRADMEKIGAQARRGERSFLLLPPEMWNGKETGYTAELMASPGSHSVDCDAVIRRHESRMALPLMAEAMFMGIDGSAGLGGELGEVKLEMFERAIRALMERIEAPINDYAIPRLMRVNGYTDRSVYPRFGFGPVSRPSLRELGTFLQQATAAAAITPDRTLENALRQRAGLPDADEGEGL